MLPIQLGLQPQSKERRVLNPIDLASKPSAGPYCEAPLARSSPSPSLSVLIRKMGIVREPTSGSSECEGP